MHYEPTTINVTNEEREALLDAFSTCETFLREETALVNQAFDDLRRCCPNDLETCKPKRLGRIEEDGANARFITLLSALGIDTAKELSAATGVEIATCDDVLANPLKCDAKRRARIMSALENPPVCAWDAIDPLTGESVGKQLAIWSREYFITPWQFKRHAAECDLKCYLIGAVSGLSDADIDSLLSALSFIGVLKAAADVARARKAADMQAASAIDSAIQSLSATKEAIEEAAACIVPKAHD